MLLKTVLDSTLCQGYTCDNIFLRGVKDWVHMKTAEMMQDFNYFCNLGVNHKLLLFAYIHN